MASLLLLLLVGRTYWGVVAVFSNKFVHPHCPYLAFLTAPFLLKYFSCGGFCHKSIIAYIDLFLVFKGPVVSKHLESKVSSGKMLQRNIWSDETKTTSYFSSFIAISSPVPCLNWFFFWVYRAKVGIVFFKRAILFKFRGCGWYEGQLLKLLLPHHNQVIC